MENLDDVLGIAVFEELDCFYQRELVYIRYYQDGLEFCTDEGEVIGHIPYSTRETMFSSLQLLFATMYLTLLIELKEISLDEKGNIAILYLKECRVNEFTPNEVQHY